MNIDTITTEVMPVKRADVTAQFATFQEQFDAIKDIAETLTVTSREQVAEMKKAREIRLTLKSIRVAIEKKRKELGEESLRQIQSINAIGKEWKDKLEAKYAASKVKKP